MVARGFDRKSLRVLAAFVAVGLAAALIWRRYVVFSLDELDPLLGACWVVMGALAIYRVDVARDGRLAAVAFAGGALIETWGTRAGLWRYFTDEQPPLFILPAWPAAALATERVCWATERVTARLSDRSARVVFGASLVAFVALLLAWSWHTALHPLTLVAYGCIAATALTGGDRRSDLTRFVAGSLVGYPLEYWGTSRGCWVYWSGETPPLVSVLSHGFATLCFARGVELSRRLLAGSR